VKNAPVVHGIQVPNSTMSPGDVNVASLKEVGSAVKRRRNGEGFIRLKPGRKSLWEIRVSVIQDDGTKRQRTFYAPSLQQAEMKLAEVRVANSQGRLKPKGSPKLDNWIADWMTRTLPTLGLKKSTVQNYIHVFNGSLREDPILSICVDRIRPLDIDRFLHRLAKKSLGTSTRRIALTLLKKSMDSAVRDGLAFSNPCTQVLRPKRDDSAEPKWLASHEVSGILTELGQSQYLPPALMMVLSGMRRGEVLALTWDDVDFHNERIFVRSTINRLNGALEVTSPKTANSRRTLHMTSEVKNLLMRLKSQREDFVTDYVFVGETGKPMEPRNFLRAFKVASTRAGFPRANLHSLRHSAASQMLNSGVPLFTVSKTLGHSSVSVTGDIYGHLDDESQKSALSLLSGKILMAFMAQSSGTSLSIEAGMLEWSGWLNSRPLDPQSSALPSCAIARD
jgi:integrase